MHCYLCHSYFVCLLLLLHKNAGKRQSLTKDKEVNFELFNLRPDCISDSPDAQHDDDDDDDDTDDDDDDEDDDRGAGESAKSELRSVAFLNISSTFKYQ